MGIGLTADCSQHALGESCGPWTFGSQQVLVDHMPSLETVENLWGVNLGHLIENNLILDQYQMTWSYSLLVLYFWTRTLNRSPPVA
jgi:hypothetical protein